jgi:hypothetical protein
MGGVGSDMRFSALQFQSGLSLDATTREKYLVPSAQYRIPGTERKLGAGAERDLARKSEVKQRLENPQATRYQLLGTAFNRSTAIPSPA